MSDWSGKYRPLLERIACLSGRSCGIPVYSGGGIPSLTDQDIASAVAVSRQIGSDGRPVPACVRPEILLLCYGCREDLVFRIARAAWNAICEHVSKEDGYTARVACMLAAQAMAGRNVTQAEMKTQAWVAGKNYKALDREFGYAKTWIEGELYEAGRAFVKFLATPEATPERARRKPSGLR